MSTVSSFYGISSKEMSRKTTERHQSIKQESSNGFKAMVPNGALISSLFFNFGDLGCCFVIIFMLLLFGICLYCKDFVFLIFCKSKVNHCPSHFLHFLFDRSIIFLKKRSLELLKLKTLACKFGNSN